MKHVHMTKPTVDVDSDSRSREGVEHQRMEAGRRAIIPGGAGRRRPKSVLIHPAAGAAFWLLFIVALMYLQNMWGVSLSPIP